MRCETVPRQIPVPSVPEYAHNVVKSSIGAGSIDRLRHSSFDIVVNSANFNPV